MDPFLSSLFVFGVLSVALSLILSSYKQNPSRRSKLPPGKLGWPTIGETLEFLSSGRKGYPENFINDRMKKYSPQVFKTSIAGHTTAVLCGASGNKLVFSNENKHVVGWWPPSIEKIAFSVSQTKTTRSILPEILKLEALRNYVPVMDCMVKQHLEKEWIPNDQVKAFPLSKKLTFSLACRLLISMEDPDRVARLADHFSHVTAGILSVPIDFPGTTFNSAIKAANRIRSELFPIIERRKSQLSEEREPGTTPDLLSQLLLASDEDGKLMSVAEIADKILGLLIASHDTTSALITFVVYFLADHPQVYARVFNEQMEIAVSKSPGELMNWEDIQKMKYSRNVINEVLRLASPSQGGFRQVISDFSYAGFTIPKGWNAFWSVQATHKNPEYFSDPDKFDPSRFEGNGPMPFTFVPFGGGPRMCPGSEFARMEVLIFLYRLVQNFKWEKLIPDEKIIYDPFPLPVHDLPIRLLPHVN